MVYGSDKYLEPVSVRKRGKTAKMGEYGYIPVRTQDVGEEMTKENQEEPGGNPGLETVVEQNHDAENVADQGILEENKENNTSDNTQNAIPQNAVDKNNSSDAENETSKSGIDTNSNDNINNVDKKENRLSHYLNNIKISKSGAELSLCDGKEKDKGSTLLSDPTAVVRFSPTWRQTLAASGSILLTFSAGLTSGYSAILLPQLKEHPGPIPYDEITASWIASMAALPMAPGCLISGWLMEKFGRRNSHYLICALFLLGWLLIACAEDLTYMLAGRFFTGICVGLLGPLGPVFIAETTEPKLRGFFLAGVSLAIALGIFAAHLIGTFMTWQWTATISCLFPILAVVLLVLVPESPTWLISKGRIDDGAKAFCWLRGYGDEAKTELKSIVDNKKAADSEPTLTWKEKLYNLKNPELMKPLLIMIVFFITCQFSGVNAVAFYSIHIVEKAVGEGIDRYLAMLIIDALRVVMSVVACVICKQYGRRPLCIISGVWTAIAMVALSMFMYFKPANMAWLPLSCLLVYITAISIGLVPLPWIMCGEVFPTRVRGIGSGISSAVAFTSFFVVVKTAPGMMKDLGEVATFLAYGVVALVGTAVLYFILPETKGKSLQEIEDRFRYGKSVERTS